MSDFKFRREYRGKVTALVLDWSGTTADAYVIAPAVVFAEVFENQGVEISMSVVKVDDTVATPTAPVTSS